MRNNKWGKTDLELLQLLKDEIYRLGIQDEPSRTKLAQQYDKKKMPHPNTYMNKFGKWEDVLRMIGIEYDGRKIMAKSSRKANTGKRYASTWSNLSRDEIIDVVLSEIKSKGFRDSYEYVEKRDKENTPSLPTIKSSTGLTWTDIRDIYNNRYSEPLREEGRNLGKDTWGQKTNNELIETVISEMKKINSDRYVDYMKKRNKGTTPSFPTLANRGITWSEVKNIYKERKQK